MTAAATVEGILPVDKPEGPTSHDVVARARRGLRTRRIGHTGTLDPFASGLLLLCVGTATRLSTYLTHLDKTYDAEALLGVATDTLDREGAVVATVAGADEVATVRVEEALSRLKGALLQVPPAFSAKKVAGEAAHRRARRGETVALEAVPVHVHAIALLEREGARIRFRVECSSGTYIRALARDLGEALGTGAHLTALRRLSVGPFHVDEAVSGDALDAVPEGAWIAPAEALHRVGFPRIEVGPGERVDLARGRRIAAVVPDDAGPVAAVSGDELLAVGEMVDGWFQPRRVFVDA